MSTDERNNFICRRGVWPSLCRVLEPLPHEGVELCWLTYSFNPSRALLDFLGSRDWEVRAIAQHPDEGMCISKIAHRNWIQTCGEGSLRGLGKHPDGEGVDEYGINHAKALAVSINGRRHLGFVGSFNLAHNSLHSNAETLVQLSPFEARILWEELDALRRHPEVTEVTAKDCQQRCRHNRPIRRQDSRPSPGHQPTTLRVVPPPAGVVEHARVPETETETETALAPLPQLVQTLDAMLANYPPGAPARGYQARAWTKLQRSFVAYDREVLVAPVGTGKTYIALRWALEMLARQAAGGEVGQVVYLVTNEWIERSIKRALDALAQETAKCHPTFDALDLGAMLERTILVRRASALRAQFDDLRDDLAGLVADECHNWNSTRAHRGRSSPHAPWYYTDAFNMLAGIDDQLPILGLSATPCRYEAGEFNIATFIARFCRREGATGCRVSSMAEAIEGGVLARPDYREIAADKQTAIRDLLETDGTLASYGDYGKLVLREVWELLAEDSASLIDDITHGIHEAGALRVVVFLPPVGEILDEFVDALSERLRAEHATVIDFRARTEQGRASESFVAFAEHVRKPGQPAVLLTIDRFSEGVSVTDVDMIVQLRATLSPRVAVQSLGRGLRLDPRKDNRCTILDAVGFERLIDQWESGSEPITLDSPSPLPVETTKAKARPRLDRAARVMAKIVASEVPLAKAEILALARLPDTDWSEFRTTLLERGLVNYTAGPHTVYGRQPTDYVIEQLGTQRSMPLSQLCDRLELYTETVRKSFLAELERDIASRSTGFSVSRKSVRRLSVPRR